MRTARLSNRRPGLDAPPCALAYGQPAPHTSSSSCRLAGWPPGAAAPCPTAPRFGGLLPAPGPRLRHHTLPGRGQGASRPVSEGWRAGSYPSWKAHAQAECEREVTGGLVQAGRRTQPVEQAAALRCSACTARPGDFAAANSSMRAHAASSRLFTARFADLPFATQLHAASTA